MAFKLDVRDKETEAIQEYDLYMRVDSNTRGHHQWFYFKVENKGVVGKVKFNILNFTKKTSLYLVGMRVNVKSKIENEKKEARAKELGKTFKNEN